MHVCCACAFVDTGEQEWDADTLDPNARCACQESMWKARIRSGLQSVEEETVFGVLDHPLQALLEVQSGHG